jgi:PTS system nitrogen regulatory IIA component
MNRQSEILSILLEREKLGSTGIGDGIAIPHGKSTELSQIISGFGLSKRGINFDSLDGKPAHLFFLLVAPENSVGTHLKMLARISRMLKNVEFRKKLLGANSQQEIYQIISEEDAKY